MSNINGNMPESPILEGVAVRLVPYSQLYAADIAALRNQQKAKYFLAQDFDLTTEMQIAWGTNNQNTCHDLGFVVQNKKDEIVGVMYIYNINQQSAELGRTVFDLNKTFGVPLALEAGILLLDYAFNILALSVIHITVKEDNILLLKFAKKLGFKTTGHVAIRSQLYITLEISSKKKTYLKFKSITNNWKNY